MTRVVMHGSTGKSFMVELEEEERFPIIPRHSHPAAFVDQTFLARGPLGALSWKVQYVGLVGTSHKHIFPGQSFFSSREAAVESATAHLQAWAAVMRLGT